MKIEYVPKRFRAESLQMIERVNQVIEEYQEKGYDLTLRQVYYQLVATDLIPNSERSYKNLGTLINDGRLAGVIDWNSIIDRTRSIRGLRSDENPQDAIRRAFAHYRLDKWKNQPYHIEVWVEKDALAGVIGSICNDIDVDYFSCRGYTSQSEMWRAARRLMYYEQKGKETVILHLGDHDPSGIDMSRDIIERLNLFGASPEFKRLALNMDQIETYNPPPNPAKLSDSRAKGYISQYGHSSWELDALKPEVLKALINDNVDPYIDQDLLQETKFQEKEDISLMDDLQINWEEVQEFLEERGYE
ncbi:hypothetical protein [Enterococcus wangshanyuanii]|uniref:DUF2399 domain-containing protein n=1 Tax=Enterococcus wangshanyuanii TaxID=2005703 RepID=A0ABQ1NHF6_9ENTE|nr:hypothetical protein [Enterococcus wangshanyuanii]GGC74755.1 hypothetical protein GCM10011573_00340 [Enterococcus wangshanyuanii]